MTPRLRVAGTIRGWSFGRKGRLGVRQRVAAALTSPGNVASRLSVFTVFSIHVFLKPSTLLEDFEYPEVKAALTRRSPRRCARPNDVQNPRRAPWSAVAVSCRFPFPGQRRFAIKRVYRVFYSRVPEAFNFIGGFRVPRSESGADTPQSKALRVVDLLRAERQCRARCSFRWKKFGVIIHARRILQTVVFRSCRIYIRVNGAWGDVVCVEVG